MNARTLGRRLMESTSDERQRVRLGFELCLSRPPQDSEQSVIEELIAAQKQLEVAEPAIWFGVARTLLNLDETISRE